MDYSILATSPFFPASRHLFFPARNHAETHSGHNSVLSKNFSFCSPRKIHGRSLFLGEGLALAEQRKAGNRVSGTVNCSCSSRRFDSMVVAAVKWRKERPFDTVIQRDKKLKLVLKLRRILVNQPDRIMNLRDLGKFRRDLGLTRKRRLIALLKRFPGVFEILEEGVYSLKFRLTPEAERIYLEELRVRNEMEHVLVVKLRKLLMMSIEKRVLIAKIAHLKTDLGLPQEFRDTICVRYPQYFQIVDTDRGPALELTHWDPALAISAAQAAEEENRVRELEERNYIIDRAPRFNRVRLPKGLVLSRGDMKRVSKFRVMPYISPYSDFSELKSGTPEKEKHAVGVVHEILSLTIEKRTLVDHLTHFREEFRFSQQLRGMLIRHPDMFYVSLKGDRDSVFLREAYRDTQLTEKNKLLALKEKMRALVGISRFGRGMRRSQNADQSTQEMDRNMEVQDEDDDDDDGEGFGDIEDLLHSLSDSDFDDDTNDDFGEEDGQSDINDVSPAEFEGRNESQNGVAKSQSAETSSKDRLLIPSLPDGKPRERW